MVCRRALLSSSVPTQTVLGSCAGISLDDLPNVTAWKKRIEERPAVQKGLDVPEPNKFKEAADPEKVVPLCTLLTLASLHHSLGTRT